MTGIMWKQEHCDVSFHTICHRNTDVTVMCAVKLWWLIYCHCGITSLITHDHLMAKRKQINDECRMCESCFYLWKITQSWVTHLATKSLLTSRKMKKHSSLGVKARWARRLRLSSLKLFRSMTCRSISSAMGGGDMGSEITHPACHARLFT